jgi:hypothetical protein
VPGSAFSVQFTGNGAAFTQVWPWTWLTGLPVLSSASGQRDMATVWTANGSEFFGSMIAQGF